jgi:hypothetical protein
MNNIKKIGENEYEAIDPQTGGRWRVVSLHALSEFGALVAIVKQITGREVSTWKGHYDNNSVETVAEHFQVLGSPNT